MKNDSNPVAIARDLTWTLKLPLPQHDVNTLREVYESKGLVPLMYAMQQHVRIDCTIVLRRGGAEFKDPHIQNAPLLPPYGTTQFRGSRVTVCLPRTFIRDAPFATLVYAIAHEYAHIVLYATRNAWRDSERATDVCASMLGYEDVVCDGHQYLTQRTEVRTKKMCWGLLSRKEVYRIEQRKGYGYLSADERAGLRLFVKSLRA